MADREEEQKRILDYLKNAYSGARMADDIDCMIRIARAIVAFNKSPDKDCIIEEFEYDDFERVMKYVKESGSVSIGVGILNAISLAEDR